MQIVPISSKTSLNWLRDKKTKNILEELKAGKKVWCLDTFFTEANEVITFDTEVSLTEGKKTETVTFRIDCALAKDKNHPNHPENSKDKNRKAVRLYYLQLQDSQKGRSGTYANVVYPQMDADPTKAQGYSVSDLIDAIINSLAEHIGYYLYV